MASHASLLVEIGTEELPPKALPDLARAFFDGVLAGLDKRGIGYERAGARPLYSPRRLAVFVPGVASEQPTQTSEVLGPYLTIGLNTEGQPTPALLGFASKNGVGVEQLAKITDGKGERFVARSHRPGAATAALLPEIVVEALKALPVPKPMRWGSREYAFVRPAHWLVLMLGDHVVQAEILGLKSGHVSRGHRFHAAGPVPLSRPEDYVDALRSAHVLVDPDERRARISAEIAAAAVRADGVAVVPDALLEEVNCLVEWPKAVLCSFEPEFLRVPEEALVSTMQSNQKFFPVLNREHRLSEHFIGIANIESKDEAEVRKGYERVIRPRFADARFFFDEDCKQGLTAMAGGLSGVTYQQKLGSYADKTARVVALAVKIAGEVGMNKDDAAIAASLSKADLQSRLVGEFPELQGIAGRYYAGQAGLSGDIGDAIDHAYMPRFSGDAIAPSKLGQVLAIAERLDTLAGGFAAGLKPTGSKDPFALRRHALGLARTLIEGEFELDLRANLALAIRPLPAGLSADADEIQDFVLDRLRGYYADKGFTGAQFDAVAELKPASLRDFDRRLQAIGEFARLPEAEALAAANKRIRNILRKAEATIPGHVDPQLLAEAAEQALHAALNTAVADTDPMLAARDYVGVLKRLAALRVPVDAFFDGVMVMADDPAVRDNRLALLKRLADRFAAVAEVALLA
jgi:glycyl-tRNA synthetase beta chain